MRRKIKGNVSYERWIDEKFSLIYMEIQFQEEHASGGKGLLIPRRSMRWHLEDEQRPQLALCGFPLHGVCKSVSPGLAMLGTPCTDCSNIIRDWISNAGKDHEYSRLRALVMTDYPFRQKVKEACGEHLFTINGDVKDPLPKDPLNLNKRKTPKKKSGK